MNTHRHRTLAASQAAVEAFGDRDPGVDEPIVYHRRDGRLGAHHLPHLRGHARDAPGDGGPHGRVVELELGELELPGGGIRVRPSHRELLIAHSGFHQVEPAPRVGDLRLRRLEAVDRRFVVAARNRLRLVEPLGALQVRARGLELGLRLLDLRAGDLELFGADAADRLAVLRVGRLEGSARLLDLEAQRVVLDPGDHVAGVDELVLPYRDRRHAPAHPGQDRRRRLRGQRTGVADGALGVCEDRRACPDGRGSIGWPGDIRREEHARRRDTQEGPDHEYDEHDPDKTRRARSPAFALTVGRGVAGAGLGCHRSSWIEPTDK